MRPKSFMLVAGEASGDELAAALVLELRKQITDAEGAPTNDYQPLRASLEPRFFGAGGSRMAAAGVELAFDLTAHSVTGLVVKKVPQFFRMMAQLRKLAIAREPDAIICVDFGFFNLWFARVIRNYARQRQDWFHDWNPKIIQYVSPQVWGSRAGRAYRIARDCDLVLSIIPFERDWYARRTPRLQVQFVGHPMLERFGAEQPATGSAALKGQTPAVLVLPGSRNGELTRHLPVMIRSLALIRATIPEVTARMVLPSQSLLQKARALGLPGWLEVQVGRLPEAFRKTDIAIAKTGTVTQECAFFGVPTVTLYKTSFLTYQYAKQVATVQSLTLPNILAGEEVFPEFIQHTATPENIARAALDLLRNEKRRAAIKIRLAEIVKSLGSPGAGRRAAQAIVALLENPAPPTPQPLLAAAT